MHEIRSEDTKTICDLMTAIFSPELEQAYSKMGARPQVGGVDSGKDEGAGRARAQELATELLADKTQFVGFASVREPIVAPPTCNWCQSLGVVANRAAT